MASSESLHCKHNLSIRIILMNRSPETRAGKVRFLSVFLQLSLVFSILPAAVVEGGQERWWGEPVEQALGKAGANRGELLSFLGKVSSERRAAAAFLVENMPQRDLSTLKADYLVENLRLAFEARAAAAWGGKLPELTLIHI